MYVSSRSHRGQASSSTPTLTADDRALASSAREVYQESLLLHGTSRRSKNNIRRFGFQAAEKNGGSTNAAIRMMRRLGTPIDRQLLEDATYYHHFTTIKDSATTYAHLTDNAQPAIVRTIGIRNNYNTEIDPHISADNPVLCLGHYRSNSTIRPRYVLGSKHSPPGEDAAVFQEELSEAGHSVSKEQAGRLLRAVQSDSDSDFE